ncbi:hypothetical protein [Aliamphritea spongicola]
MSQWVLLVDELGLSGMTYMIAANTSLEAVSEGVFRFHYADEQRNILNEVHTDRISAALSDYFQQPLQVEFELGIFSRETPSLYRSRKSQSDWRRPLLRSKPMRRFRQLLSVLAGGLIFPPLPPLMHR